MTTDDVQQLATDLKLAEGLRLKAYKDSVGVLTIGYGCNLEQLTIQESQAEAWLQRDIQNAINACQHLPWFSTLDAGRQRAMAELSYNLGMPRLSGFVKMLAAMASGDYGIAADELLNSRWAQQVGEARAMRLSELIRNG